MKELKDYMHLYLGCEFLYKIEDHEWSKPMKLTSDQLDCAHKLFNEPDCHYKLILRPLSDMTEEEAEEINSNFFERKGYKHHHIDRLLASTHTIQNCAIVFPELLKRGFDLFGLIKSGLAIDKSER